MSIQPDSSFRDNVSKRSGFMYELIYAKILNVDVILRPERIGTWRHEVLAEELPHTYLEQLERLLNDEAVHAYIFIPKNLELAHTSACTVLCPCPRY